MITADMRVDRLVANIKKPGLRATSSASSSTCSRSSSASTCAARRRQRTGVQIRTMETAFRMQREAMETFDISREPQHVRDLYGRTPSPAHACSPGGWWRMGCGS